MMYSCALYPTPNSTLAEAQQHRLKTICDKLSLQATDHIVEIGSGWGGFAIYAAQHYGCRVTTTTISEQQYQECKLRIKKLGLSDRIRLLKEDYRNLQGKYDKLVSLEMIEAVGPQYYDHFFKKCSALLKDDGIMLLQCITTVDQRYQKVIKDVDFIKRYIFPGGHLPSMTIMQNTITRETDLNLIDLHDITPHYAITLKDWRHTFNQNTSAIENLGFDESFKRLWNFYFCYCEAGFLVRTINVIQCVFVKPQWQFSSLLRIGYGN